LQRLLALSSLPSDTPKSARPTPTPAIGSQAGPAAPLHGWTSNEQSRHWSPRDRSDVIVLTEPPVLIRPTSAVRMSFLTGEQADCVSNGLPTDWLGPASENFDAFSLERGQDRERWEVVFTELWAVSGEHYLGTVIVRHSLTDALFRAGGHVDYHVVTPWRRQGHATRMLAQGLDFCRGLGLDRVLLTCSPTNEASRRVILHNGGQPDRRLGDDDRYWIGLS